MLLRRHYWIALAALGAGLLAGCVASSPVRKASASASSDAAVDDTDYSPEAVERRTEAHARYAHGVIRELNDEMDGALTEYRAAAVADPANEPLVLDVSERLLRLKQPEKALDLLLQATAPAEASGVLFARLGLIYALLGKLDAAMAADRKAIQKAPSSLAGYQQLALVHLEKKQLAEGLKVLDEAARQPVTNAAYFADLSGLYVAFGRAGRDDTIKPRALDALNRAAAQNPDSPLLLQKLAEGYDYLGEPGKAADYYLKLQERFPRYPGIREKLIQLFLGAKDRKRAMEQLESVIREAPTNPRAYYFLGGLALEEKKPKEAVEYLQKAILLDANYEPPYYDLAGAQINLNDSSAALATLARAREKFSQNFVGEYYTALAYNRMKDYSNAVNHFTACEVIARATETNRLTPTFYFQLGAAHERFRQFEEAEKYFRQSLALAPDFSEALNYLGYMWAERGQRLPEAQAMIEQAVKLEPKNAAFLDSLGWVLFKLNKPREGLPHILKAIELNDEPDSTLYDHLGDIYAALQEPQKARAAWEKALTLEPNEHREAIQKKLGVSASSGSAAP